MSAKTARPTYVDRNLISLRGGPQGREHFFSAMWFTRDDWDEVVAAQGRMAETTGGKSQRHYLDYRITDEWVPHPFMEGSGGYVAVYEPTGGSR